MEATFKTLEITGKVILAIVNMLVTVLVAILGAGGQSKTRKRRTTRQTHSANYRTVRGYSQTKGHWKHEGRMSGRTQERYRHGR